MQLTKTTTHYATYELLESFMEVSRVNIKNRKELCSNQSLPVFIETCMTRFSLGRQTGKTESIIKYAKKRSYKRNRTLIVVPNTRMRNHVTEIVRNERDKCVDAFNGEVIVTTLPSARESIRWVFEQKCEVIFDECNKDKILDFLDRAVSVTNGINNIEGIVSVGDM